MAKYTNVELCEYLKSKLGTPYVYGTDGAILTMDKLKQLRKSYPKMYTDDYFNQCAKSIGKQTFDCSGSINSFIFDDGKNYNPANDYCSSTIIDKGNNIKPISKYKEMPIGSVVWKEGHIGTYIGDGKVIETRSAYGKGLEMRNIGDNSWTHILEHPAITYVTKEAATDIKISTSVSSKYSKDILNLQKRLNAAKYRDKNGKKLKEDGYIGPLTISACPTLRKGAKGSVVKSLQELLVKNKYKIGKYGTDSVYGEDTKAAVVKFKSKHGLKATGTVTEKAWSYLTGYIK